ncbi:MAG: Fic family protein [Bifidobacteriaceae bacterium]|nr:Fic family protein [Bifidobacteriaceae bacterium]
MTSNQLELWESYFYPETYDPFEGVGTLRNLFGERDAGVLRTLEYLYVERRQRQLGEGEVHIARTYDAQHVRSAHRHLFQDVYGWAGQHRVVDMGKGQSLFADIEMGEIGRYLDDAERIVKSTDWGSLDHEGFADRAATVFAYVNQAHPFREGNGRSSKAFMQDVADLSRFSLDYGRVTSRQWNQGSELGGPDRDQYRPQPASLIPVFRAVAVPRVDNQSSAVDGVETD